MGGRRKGGEGPVAAHETMLDAAKADIRTDAPFDHIAQDLALPLSEIHAGKYEDEKINPAQ